MNDAAKLTSHGTDKMGGMGWFRKFEWWQTFKFARTRWAVVDGDQRAAAFAYYLLLSLLPLVIVLVSAGSLFVEREVATRGWHNGGSSTISTYPRGYWTWLWALFRGWCCSTGPS